MRRSKHWTAMNLSLAFAVLGLAATPANAQPGDPSLPCNRLAAVARGSPAAAWRGDEPSLAPSLTITKATSEPSGIAAEVLKSPEIRDEIGAADGTAAFVSRLPASDLYLAYTVQGTLHCQTAVFVKASSHAKPRIVSGPATAENEEGGLCWSQSADVGTAFGQAAYIEHGRTGRALAQEFRITPWTGAGWGRTCALHLDFRQVFTLTRRYCGDEAVCRGGADLAVAVAAKYRHDGDARMDLARFTYGPPADDAERAAVERAKSTLAADTDTPEFPIFDAQPDPYLSGFSYSGFAFFPLTIGGWSYVGAIGSDGVGWRTGDRTLLAVYRERDGALTPLASYVVDISNGGLTNATVSEIRPKPAKSS
jgi:hypothetical protein